MHLLLALFHASLFFWKYQLLRVECLNLNWNMDLIDSEFKFGFGLDWI